MAIGKAIKKRINKHKEKHSENTNFRKYNASNTDSLHSKVAKFCKELQTQVSTANVASKQELKSI